VSARPGTGVLDVARVEHRSVVRRAYATSPLRLLLPRNHGAAAWVYLSSYGGGLVGGDELSLTVHVGPDASAFVSSQAATKIYRSQAPTSVHLDATVAAGGQLVLWPDPVVCFAGSTYRQRQRIDLAAGAGLVLVDAMSSGRRASGERWRFDEYTSELSIASEGRLVLRDALRLAAADGDIAARMGRFDVLASAAIVGRRWTAAIEQTLAAVAAQPVERQADILVAAAPIRDAGCVLRVAGRSIEQVSAVVRRYLSFVSSFLTDDPWARKW
jgi:urease accessory protein